MPPSILTPIDQILGVFIPRVKIEEGFRAESYPDPRGFWTLGYGRHDLTIKPGMTCTEPQALGWLTDKATSVCADLDLKLSWWRQMALARAEVVLDMAYNMGVGVPPCELQPNGAGLRQFVRTLSAMQNGAYVLASQRMLQSAWAAEVGQRAERLSRQMASGVIQPLA